MNERYWLLFPNSEQRHPYRLIKSQRAKYIRIKITNDGELSVILPKGISEKHAHSFIKKKSNWIAKNLKKVSLVDNEQFPVTINLRLLDELWNVKYLAIQNTLKGHSELEEISTNELEIRGDIEDWELIKKLINKWCQFKAQVIFSEMLESLAEKHGFHFNKLTIRSQKTRWGSCTTNKNININSKLLFMPENIVKYVMIHELCHTIEMNHSSKFWQLVEDCDADYKNNRKQLKIIGRRIIF